MKKLKIAFVIPRMGGGGAERVTANLANGFSEKGHDVRIITIVSDKSFYPIKKAIKIYSANISVNRKSKITALKSQIFNLRKAFIFIKDRLLEEKPDVIISFLIETDILTFFAKRYIKDAVHICSERNDPTSRNKLIQKFLKYIYRKSDLLVCQSQNVANYYDCVDDNKKVIISNPINSQNLPPYYEGVRRKVIVSVGRLDIQKNHSLLIDSYTDVKQLFPEYKLEIYGKGYMQPELQKKIDDYRLSGYISLMGSHKNVLEKINDASLFVMSSDYEGFPNALLEAMCLGLPVICTDFSTGVAKELIKPENGFIVPVKNRNLMTEAINKVLSSSELRLSMGNNNRKLVKYFDSEVILNQWMEHIEKVYYKEKL